MSQTQRIRLADGVQFSAVRDSRFKTMKLSANIIVPLSAETASENALICGVLSRSCKAYPDFTALSKKLSSLYGADLNVSIRKSGDNQVLTLSASGLDDRYTLGGESVARELSQLLCGVIFEPNLKDNAFLEEEVEQERRQLLDLIDSEFNEKRIYANAQLVKYMCQNEVFGIKRYGTAEKIKEATPQSLFAAWQQLLKTAVFEILYIGDSAPDKAIEVFAEAFGRIDRAPVAAQTEVIRRADEP
ncbi:MAG: insulinase family protein, partial [Ruminococcus sp.]|nr:insulinase family protein [Ruminococcus sp.]